MNQAVSYPDAWVFFSLTTASELSLPVCQGPPTDLMRIVDFGDVWREGGC
jgi:hypothetical protein